MVESLPKNKALEQDEIQKISNHLTKNKVVHEIATDETNAHTI